MLLFIHWNVNPDIPLPIHLFTVQWYGLMWTFSIFGCFFLGRWILKKENISEERLVLLIQYIFLGGIIGARLGQVFFYDLDYFIRHPDEIVKVWHGGLASHGGVVGGLIAIWLFQRAHKEFSMQWLLDHVALIIYLPCSLIRLGNLFNSELPGKPSRLPWAFIFPGDTVPRHPVVLYESISYLILLIFVLMLYRRLGNTKPGFFAAFFFTATFSIRFLLEFMKEPEGAMVFNLISKTQLLSVPMILIGVILIIFIQKRDSSLAINKGIGKV